MTRVGFRSITSRLIFWILGSSALIYLLIFLAQHTLSKRILIGAIQNHADYVTHSVIKEIEEVLRSLKESSETLAVLLETLRPTGDELHQILRSFVQRNPHIYGSTIAFEPFKLDSSTENFSPYYYRRGQSIQYSNLAEEAYRYREWDWYRQAAQGQKPVWSEPYYDEGGGNVVMVTYSVPFFRTVNGEPQFTGVVTADISLAWLQDLVAAIQIGKTGYGFIISATGRFVSHPDGHLIMKETAFTLAKSRNLPQLSEIAMRMTQGLKGFVPFQSLLTGKQCWLAYAPLHLAKWSLGVLYPQDEIMAEIHALYWAELAFDLIKLLILAGMIVLISRRITRPLQALAVTTKAIAKGHLDVELPETQSSDEVGTLTRSFHAMRDSLKVYLRDLKETTAAKQRLESEMEIAQHIQMAMLPKGDTVGGILGDYEVSACLRPAKMVGGDLYNYFLIQRHHLCFAVGDVSGKGVAAALFMARTNTLVTMIADKAGTLDEILPRINHELCRDNDEFMFVTLFCGILDIETGELAYASAGHNPPVLISQRDQASRFLEIDNGPLLGLIEEGAFPVYRSVLVPGDTLFVYTDGVTEAFNEAGEPFSEERLLRRLSGLESSAAGEVTRAVLRAVEDFARPATQSDDITVFALRYRPTDAADGLENSCQIDMRS